MNYNGAAWGKESLPEFIVIVNGTFPEYILSRNSSILEESNQTMSRVTMSEIL